MSDKYNNNIKRHSVFLLLLLLPVLLFQACNHASPENKYTADLDEIRERGKLVAITDFNSTSYFLYRGEPMGFHYEMLNAFSDYLGIDLEIRTENQLSRAFEMLNSGEADLLAIGLTVNESRKKEILFSEAIDETRQVLVQRKPENWRNMTLSTLDNNLIRSQLDLAGKTVYVQESSAHAERLRALASEIGDSITIIEVPYDMEQLIKLVTRGEIDLAICDENLARVNSTYYPDIDVNTPVSFPQRIAWGLRKEKSELLLQELNEWIRSYKGTRTYAFLYAKYFRNSRSSAMVRSDYYSLNTGRVSQWDEMIKTYSETINWDWRLLASLIYQESRFMPDVVSWAGAYGLMQLMPATGANYGIDITSSPQENLKAGTRYINWLHTIFDPKIADENERLKFILASYNAGPGHVLDAMILAEKNGMDPQKWDGSVAVWLQKKSEPQYYNDADVKSGYFRGKESIAFVTEILDRYWHYRNIIPPKEN
ncbi:MAG: transporter substrate-binding domain-containing protein [Bacteroidales bacterium]|nr:transporter substrate-binding domain-containing protein [Bacteroidales bacterium]